MKLSVIIPVKNERKSFNYIDQILRDLHEQSLKPDEIIVSDANFELNEIYDADKVIMGGLPGIARNNGAKEASGDYLLFLDADISLKKNFLEKAVEEIKKEKLDIVGAKLLPYFHDQKKSSVMKNSFDRTVYYFYNLFLRISHFTKSPFLASGCLFVKKELFDEIKGFDESLHLWEDWDLAKRSSKKGKIGILKSCKAYHSMRRFETEGRFNYLYKVMFNGLRMNKSLDKIRNKKIEYKFDHYS